MEELKDFNSKKLFAKLTMPDKEFEEWLKDLGLLRRTGSVNVVATCGASVFLLT